MCMMMMMMMMTLMKLVNSATKLRHGIDKFYQPNSGLRGSKSRTSGKKQETRSQEATSGWKTGQRSHYKQQGQEARKQERIIIYIHYFYNAKTIGIQ